MNIDTDALRSLAVSLGKIGAPFAEQGLSLALSTLGGPFGGLVSQGLNLVFPAINNALGLASDTPPEQTQAAVEADPEGSAIKLQTLQEDHNFQLGMQKLTVDQGTDNANAQIALNTIEESKGGFLARTWRPLMGWGFGFTVLAKTGLIPIATWVGLCLGYHMAAAPPVDMAEIGILSGLLGLISVARTYDKQQIVKTVTKK